MFSYPQFVISLALGFSLTQLTHADILFIGLNPAQGEIRTAQNVAKNRGEKFFYWPQIDKSRLAPIEVLDEEEAGIIKDFENEMPDEEMLRKQERMVEIQSQREELRNQLNVNLATFKIFLTDLENQGVSLSAVIISGHDGNGKFWGKYSDILDSETLKQGFALAPKASASIRTVALLGCYTTSVGALDTYWKKTFPNAQIFGGYDQKGPNSEIASGHKYLAAFLAKAEQLETAKTEKEFWKLFRGLPQIRQLAASVVSNRFFANNSGPATLEKMYESCKKLRFDSDLRKSFACYYQGDAGCEDVPKDTAHGKVRLFYEELQENAHCRGILTVEEDHSLPKGELVLNLIFFENMRGNFFRLYQMQLIELDKWLRDLGINPLNLNAQTRTRTQLFKDIRQTRIAVESFGSAVQPNQAFKALFLKKFKALQRLYEIDETLLQLKPQCAPSEWVDPLQTKASSCVHASSILDATSEKQWSIWRNKGR